MSGDYTVTVTARFGEGGTAANWKVDMFDFGGTETWVSLGDLTGGEHERISTGIYSSCPCRPYAGLTSWSGNGEKGCFGNCVPITVHHRVHEYGVSPTHPYWFCLYRRCPR